MSNVDVLLAKFFCNYFLIHLVDSLVKLSSCTNKIGAIVASYFVYLIAMGDEAAKCMKEGVCIKGMGDFNVNSAAYKACKQCPISFVFLATLIRLAWSKIIHSDGSEGGAGVNRSSGRSAFFWSWGVDLILQHITHEEISWWTAELALIIEYLPLSFMRTCPCPPWPSCLCDTWSVLSQTSGMSAQFNRPPTRSRPPLTNGSRQ